MKPPRWTGGPRYIELQGPPLCSWCSEDGNFVNPDGGMRDVGWKFRDKDREMVLKYQKSSRVDALSAVGQTTQPMRARQLPRWISEVPAGRVSNLLTAAGRGKDSRTAIPELEGPLRLPIPMLLPAKVAHQAAKLRPLPKWMSKPTAYRVTKPQTTGRDRGPPQTKILDRKSSRDVLSTTA